MPQRRDSHVTQPPGRRSRRPRPPGPGARGHHEGHVGRRHAHRHARRRSHLRQGRQRQDRRPGRQRPPVRRPRQRHRRRRRRQRPPPRRPRRRHADRRRRQRPHPRRAAAPTRSTRAPATTASTCATTRPTPSTAAPATTASSPTRPTRSRAARTRRSAAGTRKPHQKGKDKGHNAPVAARPARAAVGEPPPRASRVPLLSELLRTPRRPGSWHELRAYAAQASPSRSLRPKVSFPLASRRLIMVFWIGLVGAGLRGDGADRREPAGAAQARAQVGRLRRGRVGLLVRRRRRRLGRRRRLRWRRRRRWRRLIADRGGGLDGLCIPCIHTEYALPGPRLARRRARPRLRDQARAGGALRQRRRAAEHRPGLHEPAAPPARRARRATRRPARAAATAASTA